MHSFGLWGYGCLFVCVCRESICLEQGPDRENFGPSLVCCYSKDPLALLKSNAKSLLWLINIIPPVLYPNPLLDLRFQIRSSQVSVFPMCLRCR